MINVGMDFGSTYTTVSIFREDTQVLESLSLGIGSPYISSVLALDKGAVKYGTAARLCTGKKDVRTFKAFKMLLPETDMAYLKLRGYDETYTPQKAAALFIENILRQVLKDLHDTKIHQLVIGAPEIWNEHIHEYNGCEVLKNICERIDFIEHVQVISEPAAASAFFAHNFQKSTGKPFDGKILLVDYGGGTLDITLSDISPSKKNTEEQNIEIKVLERTGAGENQDGQVGKAGIIYMETLMKAAIAQSGQCAPEDIANDGAFYRAVDILEQELQYMTLNISDTFEEYGIDDIDELNEIEFAAIEYKNEEIHISYGLLVEIYNDLIQPILDDRLNQMITYMKKHDIAYMDRNQDIFKIALVGGFGNYYLVKKQIEDKFAFSSYDQRQKNIILNRADCEKAISLGAALLAAGMVHICKTAPYEIGVWAYDGDGNLWQNTAIQFRQTLICNYIYDVRTADGEKMVVYVPFGGLTKFMVSFGNRNDTPCMAVLKPEFAKILEDICHEQCSFVHVGFSVDASETVHIHLQAYDVMHQCEDANKWDIPLAKFDEIFDFTEQRTAKAVPGNEG